MINLDKYVPIESTQYPGFYVIPGIIGYVVNTVGDVRQIFSSERRKAGIIITNSRHNEKEPYVTNYIRLNSGTYIKYMNHRLVCLAFYGPPGPE